MTNLDAAVEQLANDIMQAGYYMSDLAHKIAHEFGLVATMRRGPKSGLLE